MCFIFLDEKTDFPAVSELSWRNKNRFHLLRSCERNKPKHICILPAFSKKFLSYLTCRAIFATNRGVLYWNYNQTLWLPQMNSKSSVFPRTLETNPYSIGHTDPLRIEYATFETALWDQKRIKYYKHWNNNRDKWHTLSPTSILLTLLSSFGFNSFNARRVLGLAIFLHPLIIPLPAPTFTCTWGTGGSWEECILPLISTTSGYNFLTAPCSTNQIFDRRCRGRWRRRF